MSHNSRKRKAAPIITTRKDGSTATSYGAARGYSRPPFQVDNLVAVKHGAYSERLVTAKAVEVAKEMLDQLRRLRERRGEPSEP